MTKYRALRFNKLTPPEIERLAILAEECGEVVQMVGKILRFGYANTHPRKPEAGTNVERLEDEIGNIQNIVQMMIDSGDISKSAIRRSKTRKSKTIRKYTTFQGE